MNQQLRWSITVGQTYQLQQLIFQGVDINARDAEGHTPLVLAAKEGCLPVFQLLHRADGCPELSDNQGRAPLHYACRQGNDDIVQYLLRFLDRSSCDQVDNEGFTPLMLAATSGHINICKLLIKQIQPDLNSFTGKRQTALHFATESGHTEVVRLLLRSGATVDRRDDHDTMKGETPLMYAAKGNKTHIVGILLHAGADPTKLNKQGQTAITLAAELGHVDVVKKLLPCSPCTKHTSKHKSLRTVGDSPLVAAARNGQIAVVDLLLRSNVSRHLQIAVMEATRAGQTEVVQLIVSRLPRLVFHESEEVILVPKVHQDVFHLAVTLNHVNIVKLLIRESSVDINGWTSMGFTALHEAVRKGHTEVVRLLVTRGARTNTRDKVQDLSPLLVAALLGHTDIVHILAKSHRSGSKPYQQFIRGVDSQGNSALHFAVMKQHQDVVQVLLDYGLEPVLQNSKGQSPLHLAVYLNTSQLVALLLGAGGDLSLHDNEGNTPLIVAVMKNHVDIAWYLLDQPGMSQKRMWFNCVNQRTALQSAGILGHDRLCHLLLEHGLPLGDLQHLLVSERVIREMSEEALDLMMTFVKEPLSLMTLTVSTIRCQIGSCRISEAVTGLPLPASLQDVVALSHHRSPADLCTGTLPAAITSL